MIVFDVLFTCFSVGFSNRVIIVTVDTFHTAKTHESSITMTITGMPTATRLIPVTVDTFDTPKKMRAEKR